MLESKSSCFFWEFCKIFSRSIGTDAKFEPAVALLGLFGKSGNSQFDKDAPASFWSSTVCGPKISFGHRRPVLPSQNPSHRCTVSYKSCFSLQINKYSTKKPLNHALWCHLQFPVVFYPWFCLLTKLLKLKSICLLYIRYIIYYIIYPWNEFHNEQVGDWQPLSAQNVIAYKFKQGSSVSELRFNFLSVS